MGVVFFVVNAIFAFVLLILVLIASIYAVVSKNPDVRYQMMRDDRTSFIKSQTQLPNELDALGATARGDQKNTYKMRDLDGDDASLSSGSMRYQQGDATGVTTPGALANSNRANFHREPPHSP